MKKLFKLSILSLVFLLTSLFCDVDFAHYPRQHRQNCDCEICYQDSNHDSTRYHPLLDCIAVCNLNDVKELTATQPPTYLKSHNNQPNEPCNPCCSVRAHQNKRDNPVKFVCIFYPDHHAGIWKDSDKMNHEASQHYLVKTQTDILSISLIFCHNLILIVHIAVRCITGKGFGVKSIVAAYNSQAEAVAHSKGQSENHLVVIHLLL